MYVIMLLQWLERSIDRHVLRPAKQSYVAIRKLE